MPPVEGCAFLPFSLGPGPTGDRTARVGTVLSEGSLGFLGPLTFEECAFLPFSLGQATARVGTKRGESWLL